MGMATLVGVANGNTGKRSGRSTRRSAGRTGGKAGKTEKYERGTRSYTMSHIRGKDTTIEVLVRSYLFRQGLRFRKNDKRYPGHPDIVLPKYHVIVFVNGCFWHMHESCGKQTMPKSNVEFWNAKLMRNRERDCRQHRQLLESGWRVTNGWNGCTRRSSIPLNPTSMRRTTADGMRLPCRRRDNRGIDTFH